MLKQYNGKIDDNDLAFVLERGFKPIAALPCPVVKGKINPHATRFLDQSGRRMEVFHIKPVYYEHLNGTFRPLNEVLEHHGNKLMILKPDWDKNMHPRFLRWLMKRAEVIKGFVLLPSPLHLSPIKLDFSNIHFLTLTAYPDPSPETSTVDGRTTLSQNISWASAVAATDSDLANDDSTVSNCFEAFKAATLAQIIRSFFLFDTSSLTAGASISSAVLSLFGVGAKDDGDTTVTIAVVSSSPASNTAITTADYDQVGSTLFSDEFDNGGWNATGYNDFNFVAAGISAISKTGVSKFAVRSNKDITDTAPANATDNKAPCAMADTALTTTDPKLVVTYTIASGPANMKTWDGLATASVKTMDGLAIASVKTWNGLT